MSGWFTSWFGSTSACNYPDPSNVKVGVGYGSGGTEFTGTYGAGSTPSGLYSPADIIRWLLIDLGVLAAPSSTPWPGYTGQEPSSPDNVVTTYDVTGKEDGRVQVSGERIEHYGVQVRVRSQDYPTGYAKVREIATTLDQTVYDDVVDFGNASYLIHSCSRTGNVLSLGKEIGTSKRNLFTINLNVSLKKLS